MKPDLLKGEVIIAELLQWLEIPITEAMELTPKRVAKMYLEIFDGLYSEPPEIKTFEGKRGYVAITNIMFTSVCEHHLLPFSGQCGVAYFAEDRIIGLSKIPRIIEYWASRPQLQEKLTEAIAADIMNRLKPNGVYVEMSAEHSCMTIRGIKAHGSITNTAAMEGIIDKYEAQKLLHINRNWS